MERPVRSDSSRESEEREKRFIIRACDSCRKKKIRCEPMADICAQCAKSKTPCHFTPISVIRNRKRISRDRDRRIEELEKRLAWMEGQCGAKLPAEGQPLEGRPCTRDLGSGTDPIAEDIPESSEQDIGDLTVTEQDPITFNEYQPPFVPTFGESLLGSVPPEIEGPASPSLTLESIMISQQSIGRENAGGKENLGGFLERMERVRSGDCRACSLQV